MNKEITDEAMEAMLHQWMKTRHPVTVFLFGTYLIFSALLFPIFWLVLKCKRKL